MLRPGYFRFILLAIAVVVLLPNLVEAKRFKRYPNDLKQEAAAKPAPQPASDEFESSAPAEEEEAPGLLGYALHGRGGVVVEYIYTGDVFNNMRGGTNTRNATEYLGLFDLAITVDLDHYGFRPGGTFFMLSESFHGKGISGAHVGDYQGVQNIDVSHHSFQVSEFWWEKGFLDGLIAVRLGKQDANAEFAVVDLGGDFINASFGMTPNVPMPAWPDQTMGVVTFFQLRDWLLLKIGVFDGAPDGRTWGFSGSGTSFSIYQFNTEWSLLDGRLPGDAHVGMWYDSNDAADLVNANVYGGNHGVYMGFDQLIYKESWDRDDDQGLGVFLQYGWAPQDRNDLDDYFGAGLVYKGLVCGRDDDIIGSGVANAFFSPGLAVGERESAIELFYKIPLTPYITVQPDMQYIANPSGTERDALVGGLRFEAVL